MLQVNSVCKWFGDNCILDEVSLTIHRGNRLGLVGPNGSGKTTLLDIIAGRQMPDAGSVHWTEPNKRLGYLEQGLSYASAQSVGQVVTATQGELANAQQRLEELGTRLASAAPAEQARLLAAYAQAQTEFEAHGGYDLAHELDQVLSGLGLQDIDAETPVAILSGGQKTRLGLASLLLRRPDVLLLDEPTNHLDIQALEWLEGFLQHFAGAVLIVSHDRTFLDRSVRTILELNPLTHKLRTFGGNYSTYVQTVARERERQTQAYHEQQEQIAHVREELVKTKARAKHTETHTINFYYLKRAKKVARAAVMRERRLQRMLDSEERIDKPTSTWTMKLDFVQTPVSGQDVVQLEGLGHAFDGRFLFRDVNLLLRRSERVALVGANGSGKTTLLKIIIGQYSPSKGHVRLGANVHLGYLAQEQEGLDNAATPFDEVCRVAALTETQARTFLHCLLFAGEDAFVPVGSLSYGERARLALGKLVLGGCNLLLLDEPINHLDIPSRESFEQALRSFAGSVLIAVHDRYFISRYASTVWRIDSGTISSIRV